MKLRLLLLSLLTILFLMGCSASKPSTIEVQQAYTKCLRPNPLEVTDLSNATHFGGAENVESNLRNLNSLATYINLQNNALSCYEKQSDTSKNNNATAKK